MLLPSPICFSISAASSGVGLGMIPGSLKAVRRSVATTNKKSGTPTTGRAGLNSRAKYGQLQKRIHKNIIQVENKQ
jgi:hypothetical protein